MHIMINKAYCNHSLEDNGHLEIYFKISVHIYPRRGTIFLRGGVSPRFTLTEQLSLTTQISK